VVRRTPLVPLSGATTDPPIWLKPEILQPAQSFKIRGVFHAVARLAPEARAGGLLTVSAGNTAQALAWCGRHFGVAARSIMPDGAPAAKVEAVRRLGGEPLLVPAPEVFRFLEEREWERRPEAFVHPWIDRQVMIGHGTLGLELVEDLPAVERVYVPVGGGGLLAGVGSALRALAPRARIVAVEPEGAAALAASLSAGRPERVTCRTVCDGVAVPFITAELYPLLAGLVDEALRVPDAAVLEAVRRLAVAERIVAEPSGALALAAALADRAAGRLAGPAVCLVTGGSIDLAFLARILAPGPSANLLK